MVDLRAEKIERIANYIPPAELRGPEKGKLLIIGWGGTYGAIHQALSNLESEGTRVSHVHLNYLNPFPRNLVDIVDKFDRVLVPELNMGQLLMIMRNRFPHKEFIGFNKVQGQPLKVGEVVEKIKELI